METKMEGLKKVSSHCWWFDSHSSAKCSPWLQSTLSEMEKKIKGILSLIEGDADSFAQRAEMYYRKRPELVNMIEDSYRSYRYLVGQYELLRSEAGARRATLFKSDSDSFNQISSQKAWDSTEVDDYPESEVSEVDNLELRVVDQIGSIFMAANEELQGFRNNLEMEVHSLSLSPLNYSQSDDDCKSDDLETRDFFEKIVDNVAKLTGEVESLRMEKETLMAELERKDEEKRSVIRQLSFTVEILKEENVIMKKFIKNSKKNEGIFELKKLKNAFSGTKKFLGLTSKVQTSLIAL